MLYLHVQNVHDTIGINLARRTTLYKKNLRWNLSCLNNWRWICIYMYLVYNLLAIHILIGNRHEVNATTPCWYHSLYTWTKDIDISEDVSLWASQLNSWVEERYKVHFFRFFEFQIKLLWTLFLLLLLFFFHCTYMCQKSKPLTFELLLGNSI